MVALIAAFVLAAPAKLSGPLPYTGTNLAGGEFFTPKVNERPVYSKNFIYPTDAQFKYFADHGMNVFRVCFLWETLQPQAELPFDTTELRRLSDVVRGATRQRLTVILDPHNYARYYGKIVGTPEVPDAAFADFWRRLAMEFKAEPRVWFGLVNEPYGMPATQWVTSANAAIRAIRSTGARNKILAPGTAYSGAHSWTANWYGGSNGAAMDKLKDSGNNFAFEVHQYLDQDSSGTKPSVVSPTIGRERLTDFVKWCRARRAKAFLGEFAVGDSPEGKVALLNMMRAMEADRDVWLGYTWWAAGAWWGDYMFSIEPKEGENRLQLEWLKPHLQPRSR